MKAKTITYSLTAVGLLFGMKTIADLHKGYQKKQSSKRSLKQIIADQRKTSSKKTYLGSWQMIDSDSQYHFGLNYRDEDGSVLVNEYWADQQSDAINNERTYPLK